MRPHRLEELEFQNAILRSRPFRPPGDFKRLSASELTLGLEGKLNLGD